MRTLITLALTLSFFVTAGAQAPDTLWTRTYGGSGEDYANYVEETTDGGFVLIGTTSSYGAGGYDFYLVKTSADGDVVWQKTFGGAGADDAFEGLQSIDGGYILVGNTTSFGAGGRDFYVVKTNSVGDMIWTRTFGGSGDDYAYAVDETLDGGFIIVGSTRSFGLNDQFYIIKTNAEGDTTWTRTIGGVNNEVAYAVRQTAEGGYVIGGRTDSYGAGNYDMFLAKLDNIGNVLWSRTYGGGSLDEAHAIIQTTDGGYAIAGRTDSYSFGPYDMYLVKTDSIGFAQWTRTYGESAGDIAFWIQHTANGGYILGGHGSYGGRAADMYAVKTTAGGDTLWTKFYGGNLADYGACIRQIRDGGYVFAGVTLSFGAGSYDAFAVRLRSENPDSRVYVQSPNGGEEWRIFQNDTVRWQSYGYDGAVRIELNRAYPEGAWQMLTDSTVNDGVEAVWVTDPLSNRCRVRVSALADTLSDISDGDFAIIASQGYLALVRTGAPTVPVLNWNAGSVECPQTAAQSFRLKNFGSESIVVFQPPEPPSAEFSRVTSCGTFFALAPGQMSTCSLRLVFDPADDGMFRDTLLIQTDAVNGVNGYVRIPLSGSQVSTPAAPAVIIQPQGIHARLAWNPVTLSSGGCPVNVTAYLIFYAENLGGPYLFHGFTTDTTYVHTGVLHFAPAMYYQVVATTETLPALRSLPAGGVLTETEVRARLIE